MEGAQSNEPEFTRLLEDLERAKSTAPTREEYDLQLKQHNELIASFMRGDITEDELRVVEGEEKPGRMVIENIAELRKIVEILHSGEKEKMERELAHENAHMAKALSLGLEAKYGLQLMVARSGLTYDYQVFVSAQKPESMSGEEYRRIIEEVISAPDELSESDRIQLGHES
jgi:hypothetical protein